MKNWYFKAGKLQPEGMGYYYTKDVVGVIIEAFNYQEAYELARVKCEKIFGKQEKCDIWYGLVGYNWSITPLTEYLFNVEKKKYKQIIQRII